jgi:recombination protein RecT
MPNEVTTTRPSFSDELSADLAQKREALPSDFNMTRFVANSVALLNGNETLIKFARENGTAQIKAGLLRGAFLGLDALNGEMYLVPYGSTLNFMPSYKGMVKLCMKYATRPINTIYAKVVREGDEFEEKIVNGQPSIDFKPKPFSKAKMVCVFAVCLYKDGGMVYEVMSTADVEQCRKSSKSKNSPAWGWYEEMAKKSVLRRLAKSISLDLDGIGTEGLNAGLEIETDPKVLAEREIEEKGNSEELVVEATEATT